MLIRVISSLGCRGCGDRFLKGISELFKGIREYLNYFFEVLDVPGVDFRLCGFLRCPCAALALAPPSALGASQSRVLLALVVLVGLLVHGLVVPCVVVLCLIPYKREAPRSKGDISGVSAKDTPILKSAFPTGLGTRVTLVGCILSGPGKQTCFRHTNIGPPLVECHVPFQSDDGVMKM
ncbi:hypothetical protein TIFTF001_040842 [Ficus carica]|uniref:Uncharacterized protein n=1 Tax=Ficus carica TaxID=3494 RepID=A0AA87Z0X3_FICCA|nr:hypothetical protein TIFTF001_040842 [Ficus carica]